jgi:alpha-beta hydrolase superfamily lysophospholipase
VAIDSAPPKGVLSLKWSFLKSNWPVVSPFANKAQPFLQSVAQFRYAFAHTLALDAVKAVWEAEVVPESRRVGNGPTSAAARIDFRAEHAPLLMIAGGADHIIPASLNRTNFRKYAASPSLTELHEFPGRTHYTLGDAGWEAVADYALDWIAKR